MATGTQRYESAMVLMCHYRHRPPVGTNRLSVCSDDSHAAPSLATTSGGMAPRPRESVSVRARNIERSTGPSSAGRVSIAGRQLMVKAYVLKIGRAQV